MHNLLIFSVCLLLMLLNMKKTIGYVALSFFGFFLNGKSFDKEITLISMMAICLVVLQITLLFIVVQTFPF